MRRARLNLLAFVFLNALMGAAARAHPHVWVMTETELLFDENKALTGFRNKWTFDEIYSMFAVAAADVNQDGKYDRDELKALAQVNIDSMKEFDYFIFPKSASEALPTLQPQDYWLEFRDGKLTLFFTLPLATPLPIAKLKTFNFSIYDQGFYVAFELAKEHPVTLHGPPAGCAANVTAPNPQAPDQSLLISPQASNGFTTQYVSVVTVQCPGL